jgi:hypothetical protein
MQPDYIQPLHPWQQTHVTPEQAAAAQRERSEKAFAAIEARKQREAQREAERAKAEHEAGQAELTAYRERCAAAWRDNGGTESDFTAAWPAIRERYLVGKTTDALTRRERLIEEKVEKLREARRNGML